jgi:hypothetical protein
MEQKIEAERQAREARRLLGTMFMDQGRQFVLDGNPMRAVPFLSAAREHGVENSSLRMLFATAAH